MKAQSSSSQGNAAVSKDQSHMLPRNFSIKVMLGSWEDGTKQIRRFALHEVLEGNTFISLKKLIGLLEDITESGVPVPTTFSYMDEEGDLISISTDQELLTAITCQVWSHRRSIGLTPFVMLPKPSIEPNRANTSNSMPSAPLSSLSPRKGQDIQFSLGTPHPYRRPSRRCTCTHIVAPLCSADTLRDAAEAKLFGSTGSMVSNITSPFECRKGGDVKDLKIVKPQTKTKEMDGSFQDIPKEIEVRIARKCSSAEEKGPTSIDIPRIKWFLPKPFGTKHSPYEAFKSTEDNMILQAITAMPAYMHKSMEELRYDDFVADKKK